MRKMDFWRKMRREKEGREKRHNKLKKRKENEKRKQKVTVFLKRQYIFRYLYINFDHLDLNLLVLQL
jgi:hypothetical protein